jgi:peptide/nickel transport system permease protein
VPLRYTLRRSLQILPLVLGVVVVNFLLIHLTPGDPAAALAGDQAPQAYIEELRQRYGLNEPLIVQLGIYLEHLVTGDFGFSYSFRRPVLEVVLERIPATLLLVLAAEIPAILIGTFLLGLSSCME